MKFYIETMNGSGMKYNRKEELLNEISRMIDDCTENGGTLFDVQVESYSSCFPTEKEKSNEN